jgi:hypothetical protein
MIQLGDKVLVTTDNWFIAPDGEQYRAVFGTVKGIHRDEEMLGIKTNARSTNWYAEIGNVLIAGCQIHYAVIAGCQTHYAVKTKSYSTKPPVREIGHEGKLNVCAAPVTRIYNADEE